MKARTTAAIVGAGTVIGTGAFLLPAAASPQHATHTLKFTSISEHSVMFSRHSGATQDKDVNSKGKTIALDVNSFDVGKTGGTGGVAVDTASGDIYGTLTFTASPVTHGTLTGGTGSFKGVTGTITATNLNKAGTKTAVTITYH